MAIKIIEPRQADEMAREIVAFVRERHGDQSEQAVLEGLWLAFHSICGPLTASRMLRAFLFE